jgi:5-methylcytosine-specific restriction endonuclease McrA
MAPKFPYDRDGQDGRGSSKPRRRSGIAYFAGIQARGQIGMRRDLRKRLFAGRERVPCCFCSRELTYEEATLEHVRPRSRGGPTLVENLKISCEPCNSERGDMGYEKFRGRKGQSCAR